MRQQVKDVSQKVVLRTGHECLSVCLPLLIPLCVCVCVHCKWQLRWSNKQRAEPREEELGGMRKKSLKGVLVKENRKVTKFDVARANETFAWWIELLTNERTNERTSEPSSKTDENCVYSVMLQVAGLPTPPLYTLIPPYLPFMPGQSWRMCPTLVKLCSFGSSKRWSNVNPFVGSRA